MQTTLEEGDKERLRSQREKIMSMADGEFRSLAQWAAITTGSEAGTSARLRELSNRFGYRKERKNMGNGLFLYSILPPYQERTTAYPKEEYGQLTLSL